jgi:ech hydrogenase subunit A
MHIVEEMLSATLIILPLLAAVACYLIRASRLRSLVVMLTGAILITAALLLIPLTPFDFSPRPLRGLDIHILVQALDFLLLLLILYFGFKHRRMVIKALAVLQIMALLYFELWLNPDQQGTSALHCDHLALVMVLIISIVGSLTCYQAIAYMQNHEQHLGLKRSRQPRFFFVMMLFLGAMNGLVLANDLLILYFFFELTTLCSYLLIAHDGTTESVKNAVRALWMNSLGGAAFILALIGIHHETGSLALQQIISTGSIGAGAFLFALALLIFAALTKSAQFPFQSWLLGAMVAPTPVSALLHSSTMVKVGVYLVLRLSPLMRATFLSQSVALFGAFSFLAAAALAVGQSNGKKVLAYSTISNLGLIFACAGLNTPESLVAGMLLLVFHAIIKALLFLCVGAIEQRISSRDIEDMRGLYAEIPITALMTVMGVVMMIMPPFGILLSKWMAMEAAASNLYAIIMIALGSALTAMYWARWAGTLMSDPFAGRFKPERQPLLTWVVLGSLCAGAGLLSTVAPWLYARLIVPALGQAYLTPYTIHNGILKNAYGTFAVFPLSLVAALGFVVAILAVKRAARARVVKPYLSGVQTEHSGVFTGPMNQPVKAEAKNYYLSSIFGEIKLTVWINLGAGVLLTLMVGGTL